MTTKDMTINQSSGVDRFLKDMNSSFGEILSFYYYIESKNCLSFIHRPQGFYTTKTSSVYILYICSVIR